MADLRPPSLTHLPDDVMLRLAQHLSRVDQACLARTSARFRRVLPAALGRTRFPLQWSVQRLEALQWSLANGLHLTEDHAIGRANDIATSADLRVYQHLIGDRGLFATEQRRHVLGGFCAYHGHVDVLRWMHLELGLPVDSTWARQAAAGGSLPCLVFVRRRDESSVREDASYAAAARGHLHVLQNLAEHGGPWCEDVVAAAAEGGSLACVKFLRERVGAPWDEWTTYQAAAGGDVELLRYAHERGCPWHEETCCVAAENGHVDALRYAHEHGAPWDETTPSAAARRGHLAALRYAREQGCPWDENVAAWSAQAGHLDVLKWAADHGAPDGDRYLQEALARRERE